MQDRLVRGENLRWKFFGGPLVHPVRYPAPVHTAAPTATTTTATTITAPTTTATTSTTS